ncbi:MFS transporter [Angustibacter sp. McL0619]|uniref:MFS transporter n=1 Tax=Angustibacter sp. McL0619 TaxID=3415676 RepID=UPI003CEED2C6
MSAEPVLAAPTSPTAVEGEPPAARFTVVLASRPLRRLLIAHALATCAQVVLTLAVGLEVLERTSSGIWVAVAVSLGFAPYALFSGLAGALAGRRPARQVLAWSAVIRCVASILVLGGLLAGSPVPLLVAVSALAAVCATPSYPALAAVAPQCVPSVQLPAANALVTAVENLAWMCSPGVLGLVLLIGWQPRTTIAGAAAAFAVAAVVAMRVPRLAASGRASTGWVRDVVDGARDVFTGRGLRWPLAVAVANNFLYGYLLVGMLLVGAAAPGWLNAALTVGALAALLVVNRVANRNRTDRSLMLVLGWFCLAVVGFATIGSAGPAVVLLALAGAATMVIEVVAVTALQRAARQDAVARVFGVSDQVNVGAIALGSFAAGQLCEWWPARGVTVAVALSCLALGALAASRIPRGRAPSVA